MKNSLIFASIGALAAAIATGAAAETYAGARAVRIQDFTGTVDVAVSGQAVEAVLTKGAKTYPVDVGVENGVLVIAGEERSHRYNVHREIFGDFGDSDSETAFVEFLKDYPRLKITAPAGTDLDIDDSIVLAKAGDLKSDLSVGGDYVEAIFGDMNSADVAIGGAGDIGLGDTAEALRVTIGGSGDFIGGSAKTAELMIGGSGDIRVGAIREDATLDIGGAGDIEAFAIGGKADIGIHGSGDVAVGKVGGGAALSIAGSGDIELASVNGPTEINVAGNGDITIASGRAEDFAITIAGSGDVAFGGVSTNLDVSVVGSGNVRVAKNEGSLNVDGRGANVVVAGKRIASEDDRY